MAMDDNSSVENWYALYQKHVLRIVYAILKGRCVDPPDHAQQVEQDVWVKVLKGAGGYDSSREFVYWLNGLVRNTSIDHIKRCDPRTSPIEANEGILGDAPAAGADSRIVNRILLRELWEKLDDNERKLATLVFIEQLEVREIAHILGIKENAVRQRRFRLIRKLQKLADWR